MFSCYIFNLLSEFERRSICTTGEVQAQLHCPVNLNPGAEEKALREVIRLYEEAGGNSKKAAICNIDRKIHAFLYVNVQLSTYIEIIVIFQ